MDAAKTETEVKGQDFAKLVEAQKGAALGLGSGVAIAAIAHLLLGGWVVPILAGVILGAVIGYNVHKNQ